MKQSWEEVFQALDEAGIPENFLERRQGSPQVRTDSFWAEDAASAKSEALAAVPRKDKESDA